MVMVTTCGGIEVDAATTAGSAIAATGRSTSTTPPPGDAVAIAGCPSVAIPPGQRLYSVPGDQWSAWKKETRSQRSSIAGALESLRKSADSAMKKGPWSVVDAPSAPPGEDKRTYATLSRYWWPNPSTANGLPYVRRDGHTNPQVSDYPDEAYLNSTIDTASTLAHAYSLLGDERYAERATYLIDYFFTDPVTGMEPNFTFAQFIPGRSSIAGDGILDSRGVIRVLDVVSLLQGSHAWTGGDAKAMRMWLSSLLNWLISSPAGQAAEVAPNNHGTWYADEVTALALYLGDTVTAVDAVERYVTQLLNGQITSDGHQPLELARTNSWNYSTFNLVAATNLATTARYLGIDLYRCTGTSGTSIAQAVHFVLPYATGERRWSFPQSSSFDASLAAYPVYLAASVFGDKKAAQALPHIQIGPGSKADGIAPLNLARVGHTQ